MINEAQAANMNKAGEMFSAARKHYNETLERYANARANLFEAHRVMAREMELLFLYEASSVLSGTINDGSNERERKYLLAQWRDEDATYIEHQQCVDNAEREVRTFDAMQELLRFAISGAKREMEFAVAWMRALGASE